VLGFSLPDAAQSNLQASMGPRPVTRLAQQQPDPLLGDHQLREIFDVFSALAAQPPFSALFSKKGHTLQKP
jgi:hypothetical protein